MPFRSSLTTKIIYSKHQIGFHCFELYFFSNGMIISYITNSIWEPYQASVNEPCFYVYVHFINI